MAGTAPRKIVQTTCSGGWNSSRECGDSNKEAMEAVEVDPAVAEEVVAEIKAGAIEGAVAEVGVRNAPSFTA